jgi:predicted RNA-binding Zn-ribbon protein involved in translation (DUF1610 family)
MEWPYAIIALAAVVIAVLLIRRRAHDDRGNTCWQCGFDLTGCAARVDFRGDRRCPKCGELIESDEPGRVDDL